MVISSSSDKSVLHVLLNRSLVFLMLWVGCKSSARHLASFLLLGGKMHHESKLLA